MVLKGFQNHVDTEIPFSPGVNIMIGPTDVGKSAVLRAIRWVYRNKPRGDAFINDTYSESGQICEVQIHFDDRTWIGRRKGKGINEYIIHTLEETSKFANFERTKDIPDEVLSFLEIPKKFDWSQYNIDLNFGGQFDPTFLLGAPARTPAVIFGRLIGIELIDSASKLTSKQKGEYQRESAAIEKDIEELKKNLEECPDTTEADWLLERASEIFFETHPPLMNKSETLIQLKRDIELAIEAIRGCEKSIASFDSIPIASEKVQRWEERRKTYAELHSIGASIRQTNFYIDEIRKQHRQAEQNLEVAKSNLESTLAAMEVCPLSHGEFFEVCKAKLKSN